MGRLEKHVEDAVADYIDDPGPTIPDFTASNSAEILIQVTPTNEVEVKIIRTPSQPPVISELQKKMIKHLDALPNLKKEIAFIHPVFNSHAVIISRDVKRFKHHTEGWGVLRHLADNFLIWGFFGEMSAIREVFPVIGGSSHAHTLYIVVFS